MRALLLAALLAGAAPALAVTPVAATANAPLDPKAEKAANELFAITEFDTQFAANVNRAADVMRSGVTISQNIDSNPAMRMARAKNPQQWDIVIKRSGARQADVMQKTLADVMPQRHAMALRAYATAFTAAELNEIIAFYKSPVGRKITTSSPRIQQDISTWTQQEMGRRMAPEMQQIAQDTARDIAPLMKK